MQVNLGWHWLFRKFVSVSPPLVVEDLGLANSGEYHQPWSGELVLSNGKYISRERGIIVVGPGACTGGTVAHEFRHHLQWITGIEFNHIDCTEDGFFDYENYGRNVARYFRESTTEMDALMFERTHCPGELNELLVHLVTTEPYAQRTKQTMHNMRCHDKERCAAMCVQQKEVSISARIRQAVAKVSIAVPQRESAVC